MWIVVLYVPLRVLAASATEQRPSAATTEAASANRFICLSLSVRVGRERYGRCGVAWSCGPRCPTHTGSSVLIGEPLRGAKVAVAAPQWRTARCPVKAPDRPRLAVRRAGAGRRRRDDCFARDRGNVRLASASLMVLRTAAVVAPIQMPARSTKQVFGTGRLILP